MHIREAKQTDFESFKNLQKQIHDMHVQERPDIYREHHLELEAFEQLLAEKKVYLVENDTLVLAYAIIRLEESQDDVRKNKVHRKVVVIDEICVDDDYRSQEIGNFLFGKAILFAKEQGATGIELGVWEFNQSAIHFYESLGMTTKTRKMELNF